MASLQALTNQRLYRARLLADQLKNLDHSETSYEHKQSIEAFYDACLLQLQWAYQCYLQELAQQSNLTAPITSLEALEKHLPLMTGELLEIKQLVESDSWLANFLAEIQRQLQPTSVSHQPQASLIVSSVPSQSISDKALDFYSQLTQLVHRQRQNFLES